MDFRKKKLKPGEKSLWEQMGRDVPSEYEEKEPEEELVKEVQDTKKFKLIEGLKKKGLRGVFKK